MKRKIYNSVIPLLLGWICELFALPVFAEGEILLHRESVEIQRQTDGLSIKIPLENQSHERVVSDLTVTLLDDKYQPLSKVWKKVVLLNGKIDEQITIPLYPNTPELDKTILRFDLAGHTWLKRFTSKANEQELHILGQNQWISGSRASLRVIVTESLGGAPIKDAKIRIASSDSQNGQPITHTEAVSDENGTAALAFDIPETFHGERTLTVSVDSKFGKESITATVNIMPSAKIFLTTDKPVYQPNQLIHIRSLTTHKTTNKPLAGKSITLEVYDGKGNKVFKQIATTSDFGIASADFQLADEVNQGDYLVKAIVDEDSSEKTVQVFEYVLPKFRVTVENERKFYSPGEKVKGHLDAKYFFGKAVNDAKVTITANCFDVGFNEFAKVEGKTNAEGHYEYTFTIPNKLVGQPLFKGNTIVQMDVRVRDTADHEEQKMHTFHVAVDPLQIEVIPESGSLVAGVENELFLVASHPDGSLARPQLRIRSTWLKKELRVACDDNGMASITVIPDETPTNRDLDITAEAEGRSISVKKEIPRAEALESLLLRPDRGMYTLGQTMKLQVISPAGKDEPAFLDVVKDQQTILTRTVQLQKGRGEFALPLDSSLSGTLALNAYLIRTDGNMVRDTRQVIVTRSDDLQIQIVADREQYQPGEPAKLAIQVRSAKGEPVRAALGMNVVDESVYSLSEKEPGLAKVFFAIEQELLKPKVEIHGYSLDKVVQVSTKKYEENAKLSRALLSKLDTLSPYGLNIDTVEKKKQKALQDLEKIRQIFSMKSLPVSPKPQEVEEILFSLGDDPRSLPTVDPWGNPYVVYFDKESIMLASVGRDAAAKTIDDIQVPNYPFGFSVRDGKGKEWKLIRADMTGLVENNFHAVPNQQYNFGFGGVRRGGAIRMLKKGVAPEMQDQEGVVMLDALAPMAAAQPGAPPQEAMGTGVAAGRAGAWGMPGKADALAVGVKEAPRLRKLAEKTKLGVDAEENGLVQERIGKDVTLSSLEDLENNIKGEIDRFKIASVDKLAETETKPTGPLAVNGQVDEQQLRQELEKYLDLKPLLLEEKFKDKKELLAYIEKRKEEAGRQDVKAVRVRRYFPETLFYTPEFITDDQGEAKLDLPAADSITTWRMSAMANALSGALGDATAALKVFKPFFVDLDLPIHLTQNDEVTLPVAVYNYIDQPQEIEVSLDPQPWFELLAGELKRKVAVAAHEVTSVTYRIRAKQLGKQPITVYALGTQDNDAISKTIDVRPNGMLQAINKSARLTGTVRETLAYPPTRIVGADRMFVKIYPGVFSQIVEGLDAILQMPYGCFEQTSSTTYPNLLALRYMKDTGRVTPAIEMKAREYINLGYQRLLTFEIAGGGFNVFGNPPATRILSAYGLMEFIDMNQVYPVDENVITRTKQWLLGQMKEDGSFDPDQNYAHAEMWKSIQDNRVLATAYIALALTQAKVGSELDKTKQYLFAHQQEAKDAYTLAILCNALLALDPGNATTRQCVSRLVEMGKLQGSTMYWESEASMSFARGNHAAVETTAWAALALIRDGRFNAELGKTLNWLIQQKDSNGTWGTTHGTVLALKALINSLGQRTEKVNAVIAISVNGEKRRDVQITPDYSDVFRQIDVTPYIQEGENRIELSLQGEGSLMYQIVGNYYLPWPKEKPEKDFDISVKYDRSELRRNDTVTCQVKAKNLRRERAEMVMIDVGVPPGFQVQRPILDEYVKKGTIAKYTSMSRQLLIYLESMDGSQEVTLDVPMKATLPMVAKAPESKIYEYYNPEVKKVSIPQELKVE